MIKISYALTVCNEFLEIQKLITFLLENKRVQDEIVILYDSKNGDPEVLSYLLKFNKLPNVQTWRGFEFDGDFSNWKNLLTTYCSGDYIFQIDADELPNKTLIENLPLILEQNPDNEVYLVPRVNTVEGLTQEHIQKWGWRVDEKGWVNWPDYQWRIWKKKPEIKWRNKVHEVLEGYKTYSPLPAQEELALYHPKKIDRQEKQNKFYETL
tara:strand:+ start:840 stop:1469 length:630 start_codon:yes stop_codon:yes gene_type:complete